MRKIKNKLETDIFNSNTPEFFINMKSIPDKKSSERKAFILSEKDKCRKGINVGQVWIPGSLYFHLNFYHLQGDDLKSGKKAVFLPRLRDNEWIFFNDYEEAFKKKLIYTYFGLRQAGKTEMEASLCLRELCLFKETEAIALFSRKPDKDTFVKKMQTAIAYGEPFIIKPNIDKDWNKEEIRFGLTGVDNTPKISSRLYIYNTQDGKKIQIGSGKALKHGSKVYYEDKIGNIEDCKVGDKIFGNDGKLTTVLGVFPQGIVDLYEIELFDGRKVTCSGDHLWTVYNTETHRKKIETLTTEYLFNTFKRKTFNSKLNKDIYINRYTIPDISPINYKEQNIKINPYYLGLWLGDGTSKNPGHITTIEPEIVEFLQKYSSEIGGRLLNKDKITYKICNILDNKHSPIKDLFKYYNLIGNKHIPKDFLYNSIENRLELLRGIMDTDGYINKNGIISLSLSDKKLSEDVVNLIRSLGINCTVTEKKTSYFSKKYNKKIDGKISNIIYIGTSNINLFKLKKKSNRQVFKKRRRIGIEKIKKVNPDYATCIAVDNKDSLFLTDNYIPTHNTPSFMLMDEIAINPFRGVYDVVEPALLSDAGTLRCSPIFTFTGGETDKAKDAENFVKYPVDKQFCTTLDDGTVVGGRFLSGLYRKDCKEPKKFSEYLGITTNTWLDDYIIHVSDFDKANKKIEKEKEEASKSPDKNTFLLKRIFFPLNLEDVFLSESNNNFPRQAIEQQQKWLKENYTPLCVDFYRGNNGEVLWNHSELKPIDKFPVKPSDNHRAPVCIYEQPVKDAPQGLYVIGIDPIHSNDSTDKVVSLASITVFKRTLSPLDEIKDEIVCTYAGRPKEIVEFHELAIMIAEYYNAVGTVLYEASEMSLRQHFYLKKKSRFLAQSLDLTKSINERTKITSANGLAPTTKNQQHYMGLEVEYAKEELVEIDDDGNEYIKTGVYRIKDTMLLEEMKNYKSKGGSSRGIHDGNFDRIISFGCALTLAKWLDVHYPIKMQKAKNYVSVDNISKPKTKKIFGIDITVNKYNSNYSKKLPFWLNPK